MSNNEAQLLWAIAVVTIDSCRSLSSTGIYGLLLARQSVARYRDETGVNVPEETRIRANKQILKSSIQPDLTLPFGKFLLPALGAQIVEDMYENTSDKKLKVIRDELRKLRTSLDSSHIPVLMYLEGIAIMISNALDLEHRRFEEVKEILSQCLKHDATTPYWRARAQALITNIRYRQAKYYGEKNEEISVDVAEKLLCEHRAVLSSRSQLNDWINHAEYASVAENEAEYLHARLGIADAVTLRAQNAQQQQYIQSAVDVVLNSRDGKAFRDTLETVGDTA